MLFLTLLKERVQINMNNKNIDKIIYSPRFDNSMFNLVSSLTKDKMYPTFKSFDNNVLPSRNYIHRYFFIHSYSI